MLIALSLTYIVEYLRYTPMLQKHYDNYFMHYRRDILPDALNYVIYLWYRNTCLKINFRLLIY